MFFGVFFVVVVVFFFFFFLFFFFLFFFNFTFFVSLGASAILVIARLGCICS